MIGWSTCRGGTGCRASGEQMNEEDVTWIIDEVDQTVRLAAGLALPNVWCRGLWSTARKVVGHAETIKIEFERFTNDPSIETAEANEALEEMRTELIRIVAKAVTNALGDEVIRRARWAVPPSRELLRDYYDEDVIGAISRDNWRLAWDMVQCAAVVAQDDNG